MSSAGLAQLVAVRRPEVNSDSPRRAAGTTKGIKVARARNYCAAHMPDTTPS